MISGNGGYLIYNMLQILDTTLLLQKMPWLRKDGKLSTGTIYMYVSNTCCENFVFSD